MSFDQIVIDAIDSSPLNRGLSGAAWLDTPGNVPVVVNDADVALFDDEGNGVYQGHFLFASRGRAAIDAAKEAFRQMFEQYGADLIFGMVPDFRRDAKMIVRLAGAKYVGKRATAEGDCDLFVLSKEMWSDFQ